MQETEVILEIGILDRVRRVLQPKNLQLHRGVQVAGIIFLIILSVCDTLLLKSNLNKHVNEIELNQDACTYAE